MLNLNYKKNKQFLLYSFYGRIDKEILEEMIDDAFIIATEKFDESKSSLQTFLYTVTDNKIKNKYIRDKHFKFQNNSISINDVEFDYLLHEDTLSQKIEDEINLNKIYSIIENMEEPKSIIGLMFFRDGIKMKDISTELEININTIKSIILKMKKDLKKQLTK